MSPQVEAAIIAASVGVLTLIATVVTQYLGRRATSRDTQEALEEQRKQLDRTLAEQRTRTLNERFATAAEQLGSDKPAVRLSGVYAMAGLADDWAENRQTCINVLCGYLRIPYEPDPGEEGPLAERLAFRASREVRHTVIRVITTHLKHDAPVPWHGLDFNFTGAVFDGGDFAGAEFPSGVILFERAKFPSGLVTFYDVRFSGGTVSFIFAEFSGGGIFFRNTKFSSGRVMFDQAEFSGSTVLFTNAKFSGGKVSFNRAKFSGGKVSFSGEFPSEFSGGEVDFSNAGDWSVPPTFPWTGTPPPGVKLPKLA